MPMMPASWRWIYTGFVVVDGMLQQHSSGLNIHNDYIHNTLGLNNKKSSINIHWNHVNIKIQIVKNAI